MEVLTVNKLLEMCEELKANGMGDKRIYLSSDDEGNDFHALFYGFTFTPEKVKEYADGCMSIPDAEVNNIVLLG